LGVTSDFPLFSEKVNDVLINENIKPITVALFNARSQPGGKTDGKLKVNALKVHTFQLSLVFLKHINQFQLNLNDTDHVEKFSVIQVWYISTSSMHVV
jgi:hypothetical protein